MMQQSGTINSSVCVRIHYSRCLRLAKSSYVPTAGETSTLINVVCGAAGSVHRDCGVLPNATRSLLISDVYTM